MKSYKLVIAACFFAELLSASAYADDLQIRPGMVGGSTVPGTPSPPQNPSQAPSPSAPGVIFTYPAPQGETKTRCTRDGHEVPC
jgi:hypothetical protein